MKMKRRLYFPVLIALLVALVFGAIPLSQPATVYAAPDTESVWSGSNSVSSNLTLTKFCGVFDRFWGYGRRNMPWQETFSPISGRFKGILQEALMKNALNWQRRYRAVIAGFALALAESNYSLVYRER